MNRRELLELWQASQETKRCSLSSGADEFAAQRAASTVWNEWAANTLRDRDTLLRSGLYDDRSISARRPSGGTAETTEWLEAAKVDFSFGLFRRASDDGLRRPVENHRTTDEIVSAGRAIDFRWFIFPGPANFELAAFEGWVWFGGNEFHGATSFRGCDFHGWVGFASSEAREPTIFHAAVEFNGCTFGDDVTFEGVDFRADAAFRRCEFKNIADFSSANFMAKASFDSILSSRGFILSGAHFKEIPDFTQAKFSEAPIIDPNSICGLRKRLGGSGSAANSRKCAALKRIAAQSQDARAELEFWSEELRWRPFVSTELPQRIFQSLFSMFGNFGRSVSRPLAWWLTSGLIFYTLYSRYEVTLGSLKTCGWLNNRVSPQLYLAIVNSLPGIGAIGNTKRNVAQSCIEATLDGNDVYLDFLLLMHTLIASTLVFLLLLSLRNTFRLR